MAISPPAARPLKEGESSSQLQRLSWTIAHQPGPFWGEKKKRERDGGRWASCHGDGSTEWCWLDARSYCCSLPFSQYSKDFCSVLWILLNDRLIYSAATLWSKGTWRGEHVTSDYSSLRWWQTVCWLFTWRMLSAKMEPIKKSRTGYINSQKEDSTHLQNVLLTFEIFYALTIKSSGEQVGQIFIRSSLTPCILNSIRRILNTL